MALAAPNVIPDHDRPFQIPYRILMSLQKTAPGIDCNRFGRVPDREPVVALAVFTDRILILQIGIVIRRGELRITAFVGILDDDPIPDTVLI